MTTCWASSSLFDTSLVLLLQNSCGPGLVDFLCHDHHDHALGLAILLLHARGPCLVQHLHHDNMLGLLCLLCHIHGLDPILLLRHTGTMCNPCGGVCPTLNLNVDLQRLYNVLMEKLDLPTTLARG